MTILLTLAVLVAAPQQTPAAEQPTQAQPPAEQPPQAQPPAEQPPQVQEALPPALAPAPPVTGAAACVTRALAETGLDEHESVLLCQSATSAEPVDCFLEAGRNTFLEKEKILSLCSPTLSGRVPLYPSL